MQLLHASMHAWISLVAILPPLSNGNGNAASCFEDKALDHLVNHPPWQVSALEAEHNRSAAPS
jgi:hypothetical protein